MPHVRRWHSLAAAGLCSLVGEREPVGGIRKPVDALLAQAQVTAPPPDLALLGSFRAVRRIEHVMMSEAGRLVPEESGYVIQVNRCHPEGKRRFTVAHEICHTFFREALSSVEASVDAATGLFEIRQEEEYLCDVGASHMLLHPSWLFPFARLHCPSLDGLFEIAAECRASIEATAFQLAQSGLWACTFVFWELGVRKAERVPPEQRAFDGWEPLAEPGKKLRAYRVYGPDGVPFLPRNKSVGSDTQIYRAFSEQTRTEGDEAIEIGQRSVRAFCQSDYAPYHDETACLHPRVVSCILWESARAGTQPLAPKMFAV